MHRLPISRPPISRPIAAAAALLLAGGLAAGCSSSGSGSSGGAVTIKAMLPPGTGAITAADNKGLQKLTAEYEAAHKNVTVQWLPTNTTDITQSNAAVQSQASGGSAPDLVWEQYGPVTSGGLPNGLLQNMKPYLVKPNPYVPGNASWLSLFSASTVPYMTSPNGDIDIILGSDVETGMFYSKAAFAKAGLAQLVIGLADGTTQWVATDDAWQATFAAIRHADLLMGERHDLAREPHGWDRPGFDAAGWRPVRCRDRDGRPLVADPGPPVRVTEEIQPASITADAAGRLIADFGQNLTGWLRVSTDSPAGASVRIRHAEVLAADGGLYTSNLRTARQTDEFAAAAGPATFEPRFTLHGFRYAELDGYPGQPGPADIVARVAHSDIPATGAFDSSEPWLNQLFRNIDWGQRGNFISVPTDCPQRDERLGWLGDAQVFARTACYNRDVAAFFHKWLDDVADAQYPSGAFSDIAPRLNVPWAGAPAWGDAGVIVPWTLHKMYGDTAILRRHFAAMTRWMDFIERDNPDYLRTRNLGNSYNDWLAPGDDETSPELLATAYWAYDAALMAEIADAAGHPEQAAGYRALRAKIGAAFAGAFLAADGQLTSGTQTGYVLGLHMQLIPDELRAAAAGHLVAAIRRADWHLTTGFAGVGYLLPVLSGTGHTDVAYRLLAQQTAPSWRYMVDHGATTIWERWDGWTEQRGFQSAWMNSFNHYALGSVGEWLYRFVLGIDQAPGQAGFGRLLIRPHPGGSLRAASGSYRSVRGLIRSGWQRDGETLRFKVEIPPNASACIRVPSPDAASVRDGTGGRAAAVAGYPGLPGVQEAVFEVGSGTHEFAGPGAWADLPR